MFRSCRFPYIKLSFESSEKCRDRRGFLGSEAFSPEAPDMNLERSVHTHLARDRVAQTRTHAHAPQPLGTVHSSDVLPHRMAGEATRTRDGEAGTCHLGRPELRLPPLLRHCLFSLGALPAARLPPRCVFVEILFPWMTHTQGFPTTAISTFGDVFPPLAALWLPNDSTRSRSTRRIFKIGLSNRWIVVDCRL